MRPVAPGRFRLHRVPFSLPPHRLAAGAYAAFPAGEANAHHLCNRSGRPARLLAVGTRHRGEEAITYPDLPGAPRILVARDAAGDRLPTGSGGEGGGSVVIATLGNVSIGGTVSANGANGVNPGGATDIPGSGGGAGRPA